MGGAINIKISGIEALQRQLGIIDKAMIPAVKRAVNKSSAIVATDAKYLCPVDTGNLRGSIHLRPAVERAGHVEGAVYTSVEYAPYVEFGTGARGYYPYDTNIPLAYDRTRPGQAAQPFLYPALLRNKNNIRLLIAQASKSTGAQ